MVRNLVFVSEMACREVLGVAEVVERVEQAFHWEAAGGVIYSSPHVLRMVYAGDSRAGGKATFRTKGAIFPGLGVAGFRLGGSRVAADGSGAASPDATRLVLLMDIENASPLALVDEHYNFKLRTAASVAVAVKNLAPEHPRLGLVGVRGVGIAVAKIFAHVLPLESLHVMSRSPESRRQFAEDMQKELPVSIEVVDSIDEIVENANLIVTGTSTHEPFMKKSHIRPGSLICALGKYELESDMYKSFDKLIVDDWEQTVRAPDIELLVRGGSLSFDDVYAESVDVVVGTKPGRTSQTETILLRSEGIGSHDIAVAHYAYTQALNRGLAVRL